MDNPDNGDSLVRCKHDLYRPEFRDDRGACPPCQVKIAIARGKLARGEYDQPDDWRMGIAIEGLIRTNPELRLLAKDIS